MHHLAGIFIKEMPTETIDGKVLYKFRMFYPQKNRDYYVEKEEEYKLWIKYISQAVGFFNLNEKYEIGDTLGKGKFGLVKKVKNRFTNEELAVKIITKASLVTNTEKELIKQEIEILKICQHPNIIKIYDVFENHDYFYIFLELCEGKDLFSWLDQRKFKITELQAVYIVHQVLTAVCYLHEYGIVHRDLKPENILVFNNTNELPTIKLTDFGLSKIIGPNEHCYEPYGTLSYVAPEVLLEKPYNRAVDMWSIGVMSYLLLTGRFPFDSKNKKEVARQTMYDVTPFPQNLWNNTSSEAKYFVDCCLQKSPNKRITIKEALCHSWINLYASKEIEKRKHSKTYDKLSEFEAFAKSFNNQDK